jgi:hypothetical protein
MVLKRGTYILFVVPKIQTHLSNISFRLFSGPTKKKRKERKTVAA